MKSDGKVNFYLCMIIKREIKGSKCSIIRLMDKEKIGVFDNPKNDFRINQYT